MGFFDLSGSLGRHFGSIGLALNEITTEICIAHAEQSTLSGVSSARVLPCIKALCRALNVSDKLGIHITSAIPEHIGLGSGTQMALAAGMALNRLYQLNLSVQDIAQLTERGARSGIGIGIFEYGGMVVDGGRGDRTKTPPVISHMQVPDDWRFILIFDKRGKGLHGEQEVKAFKELPPFPRREAERLCYLLMMQGLPALAEGDIERFGDVISQLQCTVGEHFAAAQGGVFTSSEVSSVISWLAEQGAVALGQTSWGPTGFCAVAGVERAAQLKQQVEQRFAHLHTVSLMITSARNCGGDVFVAQ